MITFFKNSLLLFMLLNPFLIIIYMIDVVKKNSLHRFISILVRASVITSVVFIAFALVGNAIFSDIIQARFASFQIFGGLIFLIIGVQFVMNGPQAIEMLRGDSDNIAGSIAMPILIGPGTISAAVLVGQKLNTVFSIVSIVLTLSVCVFIMIMLKILHDFIAPRKEDLIQRYIEVVGRITALYVGTISIEMIMSGIHDWFFKT